MKSGEIMHNILIIDDEVEVTKSLNRLFRNKYNVYTTTRAVEAIRIMDEVDIQVILSDQRMPEMTGVEFFKRIRDKYPEIPKIILTGYSDIDAVIDAVNQGQLFRYVSKPWNPLELEAVVREAFEKHDLIRENRKLLDDLKESNRTLEEKVNIRTVELEERNQMLKELNVEKNKYIGIVSHDLRNPIGVARSFSQLLIEKFDTFLPEKHLQFLKIIDERCNFSLNLIEDLLDVTKIEAGVFELDLLEYDYIHFIREVVDQNRYLAHQKGQTIIIREELHLLRFRFDRKRIEQVLNNLLSNAIKYSPQDKEIVIEIVRSGSEVVTKIIDQGVGIRSGELEMLFNPYQLTSAKATANEKSTGLGLAIVKKIVEAHQGRITVTSELNVGSVFTFYLKT